MTQTQLELLLQEVPDRTLRYRTARLHRQGLIGRTRPYRERGSAPHHLWPTRRGDALARGAPLPRGGERREPNPTFIAHAAALTGFYVALATDLPAGVRLAAFAREGEAREPFRARDGRRRAIAPDARIVLAGENGRLLVGFLEVDLGTMSHRRLRAKARGYADCARAGAWADRHDFCPVLLFATIAPRRALAFLDTLERELERESDLLACACALAREPERAVVQPVWHLLGTDESVDLVEALREARRPYDEERARREEIRRREETERERFRRDPAVFRSHLRRRARGIPRRFDEPGRTALELLVEGEGELAAPELRALGAVWAMLPDPLTGRWAEREPSAGEGAAFAALAEHYRSAQLETVTGLARRLGEGPALRRARRKLRPGGLLSSSDLRWLRSDAERESEARAKQEKLRLTYLSRREREARALAKAQGLASRLRHGPAEFLADVDHRLLRYCRDCEEIAYPGGEEEAGWSRPDDAAQLCPFCGRGGLERFDGALRAEDGEERV